MAEEVTPLAQTLPNVKHVGYNNRAATLYTLCVTANSKGKSVPVPSPWAAYDHSAVKYLAPLCQAYGLPVPTKLDYNAFTSVVNNIITAIG